MAQTGFGPRGLCHAPTPEPGAIGLTSILSPPMSSTDTLPPGSGLDLQDPAVVIDLFERASLAVLSHPQRRGCVYELPKPAGPGHRLTLTGDLHDNLGNLTRIIKLAKLDDPKNQVVLHELSHGDQLVNGVDMSAITVARVAALVLDFPQQVMMLQSNHDLAQYRGEGISKAGVSVVEAFDSGVEYLYHDEAPRVIEAMNKFFRSFGAAIRCANGVFVSHSLPAPRYLDTFDASMLDRDLSDDDLEPPTGSLYLMVWGRHHNDTVAEIFQERLDAKVFVVGHQPAEMGYELEGQHILIINSDHSHGVALPIDLSETYDQEKLIECVVPLNSVSL